SGMACSWRPDPLNRDGARRKRALCLLRGGGKRRQLADVAHIMLDDDRRVERRRDLLEAIERGGSLGAVRIEGRNPVRFVVLVEMHEVAAQEHHALLLQAYQQAAVAGRVAWRAENDHRAVAEHVLVERERLVLAPAGRPARERRSVYA